MASCKVRGIVSVDGSAESRAASVRAPCARIQVAKSLIRNLRRCRAVIGTGLASQRLQRVALQYFDLLRHLAPGSAGSSAPVRHRGGTRSERPPGAVRRFPCWPPGFPAPPWRPRKRLAARRLRARRQAGPVWSWFWHVRPCSGEFRILRQSGLAQIRIVNVAHTHEMLSIDHPISWMTCALWSSFRMRSKGHLHDDPGRLFRLKRQNNQTLNFSARVQSALVSEIGGAGQGPPVASFCVSLW